MFGVHLWFMNDFPQWWLVNGRPMIVVTINFNSGWFCKRPILNLRILNLVNRRKLATVGKSGLTL